MSKKEMKLMISMLDDYVNHFEITNNKSFLMKIYGIFTIKTNLFEEINIILMQNSLQMKSQNSQQLTFDLKGSIIGRHTKISPKDHKFWQNNIHGHKRVLKEINIMEMNRDINLINLENKMI